MIRDLNTVAYKHSCNHAYVHSHMRAYELATMRMTQTLLVSHVPSP